MQPGFRGGASLPGELTALFEQRSIQPPRALSLYVARRLIEAHMGRIGCEGSTVWFTLPTEPRLLRDV